MNISSVVVHARAEDAARVQTELAAWPGVEVPAAAPDGRLVVTIDAASDREAGEIYDRIRTLEGVMSVALVYHHFEPGESAGEFEAGSIDARMPQEEARHDH
ncbi:MAG: chaperone NapD [Betaproteobacteria bacterium]|jgi:nitrate reductase NapD|nr:chaperone NapD [Betaproteobacteria bacterium]MCC6246520.1 chaperone NapD [Rubrivivax sp.]MCL4699842.1 chaperone NapD [Burkholderiaceae bacterium]